MSQRLRPFFLTGVLLILTSLLGALLTGEWLHLRKKPSNQGLKENTATISTPETGLTADNFVLPGVNEYQQMVERPLFLESRRPPPPKSEEPPTPPSPPPPEKATPVNFKVMGILSTPEGRMALIADAKGKYKRLKAKDSLDGWQISEIKPDRLLIEQGPFKEDLSLLKKRPKGTAQMPTPASSNTPAPQATRPVNQRQPHGPMATQAPTPIAQEPSDVRDGMGEPPPDESDNEDMNDMGDMEQ